MSEAIANAGTARARPHYKETLDLREVLYLFRDNFGKIFICVALGVAVALFYLHHAKPVFASSALLEVAQANAQPGSPMTEVETSELLKTVELKLASQSVLLSVIKRHKLTEDPDFLRRDDGFFAPGSQPAAWMSEGLEAIGATELASKFQREPARVDAIPSDAELARHFASKVKVGVMRGSRLISLRVEDRSPEKAQLLTQAIVEDFFSQSRDTRRKDVISNRELLQAEVKRVGEEFRASQEKLEEYRAKFNAVSLAERQNIVVERLRELNQQAATAKNNRRNREAEFDQVTRLQDAPPEQMLSIRGVAEAQEIIDMRRQVTSKDAEVATKAQRYGPLHPTMVQEKSELAELKSSFHAAIRKAAVRIRESFESAKAVEKSLDEALGEQEKAALALDRIAIPYRSRA